MLDGYAEFCNDSMRSQVYFERTGRYRASNYAEVAQECYHNEEHMTRRYLPGMFVSHFVWPQHYLMQRGFQDLLLPRVANSKLFFEVGVGCGVYSKLTLTNLPQTRGVGFDISQFALDYTGWMLGRFGLRERYELENLDIRHGYHTPCDFLICQEVLEHLENPAEFCRWLASMVRPGGHAYITAALNAAHSDHIFLFNNPAELEEMLRAAGLQPLHAQEEFAPGFKPRKISPSLAGFFCEKPK
jgi:SAM-dependent methyltransferase